MRASRRPSTISEPMRKALRLMADRWPDGVSGLDDLVRHGFTYAALTGLERRGLATMRRGRFFITERGRALLEPSDAHPRR